MAKSIRIITQSKGFTASRRLFLDGVEVDILQGQFFRGAA